MPRYDGDLVQLHPHHAACNIRKSKEKRQVFRTVKEMRHVRPRGTRKKKRKRKKNLEEGHAFIHPYKFHPSMT